MLRSVTLDNFILFRNRQRLELQAGPNFIIGTNGTGKSSVFELVHRCLSNELNLSASNIHDRTKPGFVVCEYEVKDDFVTSLKESGITFSREAKLFACVFAKNFEVGKFPVHIDATTSSGVLHKVVFSSEELSVNYMANSV